MASSSTIANCEKLTKDQGWSWVVLAAVGLAQMLALGQVLSFGIFFVELLDEFRCSRHEAALVGALAFGVKCFTAAPASVAQRKYGCRIVIMTGGILASTGLLLSYLATRLWHLYVTYGILVGLGFGCTFVPSVGALADYFDKYRFFATAFAPVGSAVGTFLFSPFNYYLIETYTWRGAMMILSGVSLQICVFGAILKSRTVQKDLSWSNLMERSLFSNRKFILFLCDAFCFGGTTYIVFTMANSLAIKLGLTKAQSTYVVSTIGLCNLCGRLLSALASTSSKLNRPLVFAMSSLLCGVGTLLSTICSVWWTVALSLGLFGVCFGAKVSQLGPVIIDLFGVPKLVNGMGYYMFIVGASGILGPWLGGLLADKTQVESAFWLAGSLSLVAACICFSIVWERSSEEKAPFRMVPKLETTQTLADENANEKFEQIIPLNDTFVINSRSSRNKKNIPSETPRRGWRPALLFQGEN